jgi:glycosyltransferase involved in cell wall biosynthesis
MVGSLPPPIGGVANHCYYLTKELNNLGVKITFFDTNPCENKSIPKGIYNYEMLKNFLSLITIYNIILIFKRKNLKKFIILNKNIFKKCIEFKKFFDKKDIHDVFIIALFLFFKLSKNKVDIIHSQHAYLRSLSALIVGNTFNIPVIITIHASELTSKDIKIQKLQPVIIDLLNNANKVISVSKQTKKVAKKKGVNNEIITIYNGVDSSFNENYNTEDLKTRYNITTEKIILYVGWLIERKGPKVILEAVSKIRDNNYKVFLIGPDHGFKNVLEKYIKEFSLNQVNLIGVVDDITLKKFYSLTDIFVFPTITQDEGFGLVAVEAMASETVVIGSRIAAIPEVVKDNISGYLFTPGDSKELTKIIEMLLKNDKILNTMKKKAKEFVNKNFSWKLNAKKTLNIYHEVKNKQFKI